MPSRVQYSQSYSWLHSLLRPLRVPIVFLLSGLASFCAFKDGSAMIGGSGPAAGGLRNEKLVLWDADLMPKGERMSVREKISARFGEQVNPDVLVVYDVPDFKQLLKLRDALGLYGYTAVMSNFFCGRAPRGMAWPLEIAVLSRYPIGDATQFDAPGQVEKHCDTPSPERNGPVVAARKTLKSSAVGGHRWPTASGRPIPGPGLLTVRIGSLDAAIVAVRVPARSEYHGVSATALTAMRLALAARAHAWMAKEIGQTPDSHVFAMGDFGVDAAHVRHLVVDANPSGDHDRGDEIDRLMGLRTATSKAMGGHAVSLTQALVEEGLAPGVYPHSDRIYLWANGPQGFGDARRADNSYGSRAFPLIVRSSGVTCVADPRLMRYRLSPSLAGLSKQFFVVSETGLDRQLAALRRARGAKERWVVSIDLDGLLIDNSPFLTAIAEQCREPTRRDWITWLESGRAQLMPGAGEFMRALHARALRDNGKILLLTARGDGLEGATMAELERLGVVTGKNDGIVEIKHAATPRARSLIWKKATAGGARLALVLGSRADQFPTDPALPVGGTGRSCPDNPEAHRHPLELLGTEGAHFGHCFFVLPVHVL